MLFEDVQMLQREYRATVLTMSGAAMSASANGPVAYSSPAGLSRPALLRHLKTISSLVSNAPIGIGHLRSLWLEFSSRNLCIHLCTVLRTDARAAQATSNQAQSAWICGPRFWHSCKE